MVSKIKPQYSEKAMTILRARYFLPGEDLEGMLERVSFGNADYYNLMAAQDFMPNSPTLFNAGTDNGTLSACFKFDVPDSMVGIMDVAKKAAMVLKYGGGVGYTLSALRPSGSPVRTTHKVASGPVGFLEIYQAVAASITAGGKRRGAQMAILHCDHDDVLEFINLKSDQEKADKYDTFNISVAATDAWMERNIQQEQYSEGNLLYRMAQNAWRTGDPGLYFIDQAERHNPTPWLGKLTGTNPCGEVPLLDNEPCNLGSINLGHMTTGFADSMDLNPELKIDWAKLENTTRLGIRFLDDILDHNIFPHPDITTAAFTTRKLGLGVMGWADMLAMLHIHYDSEEAVELGRKVMAKISEWAQETTVALAMEKGIAPCFEDKNYYRRNATVTCIAPTGTIAIICDASSGIEPHFAVENTRETYEGIILNESMGDYGNFKPKSSHEIPYDWHLRHQATFQEHTDLAVSKTINLPESASIEDIYNAYVAAWKMGCKGITVYRDKSREKQVLTKTELNPEPRYDELYQKSMAMTDSEFQQASKKWYLGETHYHGRKKLPSERNAIVHKFEVGGQDFYITVGRYDDGTPGELFIKGAKEGSTLTGLLDTIGILTSLSLQHGVPLNALTTKLRGTTFEPQGFTDNERIPNVTSIVDYIFRWMEYRFGEKINKINGNHQVEQAPRFLDKQLITLNEAIAVATGDMCPECNGLLRPDGNCYVCPKCGFSKC